MPKAEFVKELKELGYEVNELDGDRVWFPYEIQTGRLSGQEIKLGFVVGGSTSTLLRARTCLPGCCR